MRWTDLSMSLARDIPRELHNLLLGLALDRPQLLNERCERADLGGRDLADDSFHF